MAREDPVKEVEEGYWPKKRLTAAATGLVLTALGFMIEKIFRSVLETALSIVAGASIILLLTGLFGFFSAWEHRENIHKQDLNRMEAKMDRYSSEREVECASCSFNWQSLMVGISANHVNELQEQRDFYEDYIAAVVWTLDNTILRAVKAESSILPIVDGLMKSPLYKQQLNNKELLKWKNFLNMIRDGLTKQD